MRGITMDLKDISDSREVMESRESPKISIFIYSVLGILLIAVIFACCFEIDEYSRVTGEIKTQSASSFVIAPSSCKLESIAVIEGQSVNEGDVLFTLNNDYAKEQKESLDAQLFEINKQLEGASLLKQSVEAGASAFPADMESSTYHNRYLQYADSLEMKSGDMENSEKQQQQKTDEYKRSLKETESELKETNQQLTEYKNFLSCIERDTAYTGVDSLLQAQYYEFSTGYAKSKLVYEQYQRIYEQTNAAFAANTEGITQANVDTAKYNADIAKLDLDSVKASFISEIKAVIAKLEDSIKTLNKNKTDIQYSIDSITDAGEYAELSKASIKREMIISLDVEADKLESSKKTVEAQLMELSYTLENSVITSTCNGTANFVKTMNVGDIVQGGEQLCSIVPNDTSELKAILYIPESEITKMEVGLPTKYIISSMPYSEYGYIEGEILSISSDSIANETAGTKFYTAQASLSSLSLENSKGEIRTLKSGMIIEAKAITGSRKVIVWLLDKINLID